MAVKQYRKSEIVEAIQFLNTEKTHIDEIIAFVGIPVSIDFRNEGVFLRVIRGHYNVLEVPMSNYIIKYGDGSLKTCSPDHFDYEEVEA